MTWRDEVYVRKMAYNPLPTAKLCKKTEVKKLYNLCSNF